MAGPSGRVPARVVDEAAAHEIVNQLKAFASGQGAAASFLAAYPKGAVFRTTDPVSPAARFGGTWEPLPSLEGFAWRRMDDGDDGTAEQFMQSHPVGCIYEACEDDSPARFGGEWDYVPSLGGYKWVRTA